MIRFIRAVTGLTYLLALVLFTPIALAQTLTPEQIAQLQKLSPDQQRSLAKQAGIDISGFTANQSSDQPNLSEDTPANSNNDRAFDTREKNSKNRSEQDRDRKYNNKRRDEFGQRRDNYNNKSDETYDHQYDHQYNDQYDDYDSEYTDDQMMQPELALYGSDLFRDDWSAFRPAVTVPIPAEYIVGPGDGLIVQLYGKENTSHSFIINREGQVQFPQIGPVTLAGLSFKKAQDVISNMIAEQKIGVKASVTMGELRTIRIFVLGDVKNPGSFTIGALSTLTNALFESGGITPVGSLRNIQVKRRGKVAATFDLYDLLLKGDTSNDVRLQPGDVIFVPPVGKTVSIAGEVKRPAIYEVTSSVTAQDMIQLAGGLNNTAYAPESQLVRFSDLGERYIVNLDLSAPKNLAYRLKDGDSLTIAANLDIINNEVSIKGHLKRPGSHSWEKGLRFTDLVPSPNQMLPNPDVDTALIQRYDPVTLQVSALHFSPKRAWLQPKSGHNPILEPRDIIEVFNYEQERTERLELLVTQLQNQADYSERKQTVNISGSVRFPGVYPLTHNMTTVQLIGLAGGLLESAMGTNGEITRYTIDAKRRRAVEHIAVDLTYGAVALQPADTLQIKQIPLWKTKETVEVTGEVMYPGTYTIVPRETLSHLLERAGGVTVQAYPEGAIFSREQLRKLEAERIAEFKGKLENDIATQTVNSEKAAGKIDASEAQILLKNLESLRPMGRMVIDLPRVIADPRSADIELESGDALNIPRYKPSVTVVGEVQYPTSHFYEKSFDATTYVDRSGGLKKHADRARIYIVKANGLVVQPSHSRWFRAKDTPILPGDTIVVPVETDRVDKLSVWSQITTIIYNAGFGAAAILAL